MRTRALGLTTLMCASLVLPGVADAAAPGHGPVFPPLAGDLEAHYDFDHPVPGDPAREVDQGRSGTTLDLVNGGADMRVPDGAHPGSRHSIQTRQIDPAAEGNDDWKAGVFSPDGVPTLNAFSETTGTTVMGWFKVTGERHPAPDTTTPDPGDRFNAVGLAGVLSGDSEGHGVRALLELIEVDGELRLVALGRRVDGESSRTFAAHEDWQRLLPRGEWVFLTATFDFDDGTMALYRNGERVPGFYTDSGDPWDVEGPPEPDRTSATNPAGIKIGGSFPQNNRERNPCDCRFDSLMFFDRSLTAGEVAHQYHWARRW
ncbi:LamG-like jellyroll fold domain-containing protein [Saccharomonospora saliphila]|uniref:LamG-like jellyroll fold domain-containing protein n=1 Tax=Saccharomonospora saliphila TaxID=369829 RepID=UPI00036C2417|nr:LamG-like jellyroll fold domain-containing protein [Saccharomonospora saliphila]